MFPLPRIKPSIRPWAFDPVGQHRRSMDIRKRIAKLVGLCIGRFVFGHGKKDRPTKTGPTFSHLMSFYQHHYQLISGIKIEIRMIRLGYGKIKKINERLIRLTIFYFDVYF